MRPRTLKERRPDGLSDAAVIILSSGDCKKVYIPPNFSTVGSLSADVTPDRGIISRLSPRAQTRLRATATRKAYANGQLIHQRGDKRAGVEFIVSGFVRMGAVGRTGQVISASLLSAGDMFGEITVFAGLPRMQDAHAYGPVVIDHVSAARFRLFLEEFPEVVELILEVMARRQARAIVAIDEILRLPLIDRLGRQLIELDRIGGHTGTVPVAKNDLAERLGASRVAVSNALAQLAAHGFVRSGYGRVDIVAKDGLRSWLASRNDAHPMSSLSDEAD